MLSKEMVECGRMHMRGYSKCGGFIGFLARHSEMDVIPSECLNCPQLCNCIIP